MCGRGGMADTLVLGANVFDVWVQVPPPAPLKGHILFVCVLLILRWGLKPKRVRALRKRLIIVFSEYARDGYREHCGAVVEGARRECAFVPPPAPLKDLNFDKKLRSFSIKSEPSEDFI